MARFDYGRMQATATRLLTRFNQGTVQFLRATPSDPDPDEPWTPGTPSNELFTLAATVRRVEQKYVDGTLIVGTEDQVIFAVPSIVPNMTDTIIVDGTVRVMKDLRPVPAAGTPVAYIAFVAGGGTDDAAAVTSQPSFDFSYPANSQYITLL